VRKAPKRKGESANQDEFAATVRYAKRVWATDPELRAQYNSVARAKGRQGFHLAKAEFRLPPKVEEIELMDYAGKPSELIRIRAVDDFEVKTVGVMVVTDSKSSPQCSARLWGYRGSSRS
jgi:hypothetical protein